MPRFLIKISFRIVFPAFFVYTGKGIFFILKVKDAEA